jgi:hypothetical protein
LVCCLGAFEWVANQPTLHKHNDHYCIEVEACTSKKMLSDVGADRSTCLSGKTFRMKRHADCVSERTGSWRKWKAGMKVKGSSLATRMMPWGL